MSKKQVIIFFLIFVIGLFPRVWKFGQYPTALFEDEVANGVDAYDVMTYGKDRTGIPYPMQFVSWGSGQSAFYAYTSIPFMKIWGLNPVTIRLPNLIAGILIIPLIFFCARKILNTRYGLIAMFLVAISPWNIMGSRWGLEAYFAPFMFLIGFTCYLYSEKNNYWFVLGSIVFSLSFYNYSTTFAVVPVFMFFSIIILIRSRKLSWKSLLLGLLLAVLVALPMGCFMYVNSFDKQGFRILKLSIPKLPTTPRYQDTVSIFQKDSIENILSNLKSLASLLWFQKDGNPWNSVEPIGYLYPFSIIPCVIGTIWGGINYRKTRNTSYLFVFFWLMAALVIGALQIANIHRLSLLYIPMTLAIALAIYEIGLISNWGERIFIGVYLLCFIWFAQQYFMDNNYKHKMEKSVNYGIISALQYEQENPQEQVCISENINANYIYILYLEKPNPVDYLVYKGYIDQYQPFKKPGILDRFVFTLSNCDYKKSGMVVLKEDESVPAMLKNQIPEKFGFLHVYFLHE